MSTPHCSGEQQALADTQPSRRSPQSLDNFDFDSFSLSELNVGGSPIDVERLLDICGDDIMLVSDVLDTFCVQGRDRVESLEDATRNCDIRQAIFDSVRR